MDLLGQLLTLQTQLIVLIAAGVVVAKLGVIDEAGRKTLSTLLIDLILPCNIICSFLGGTAFTAELVKNCLLAVLICAVLQVVIVAGSALVFRRFPREKKVIMSYGMLCSNSTFIGLPVSEALYGPVGVMYASIFQIPNRIVIWTLGLSWFTRERQKPDLKKLLLHPCIISVFIGAGLMALQIDLPAVAYETLSALSRCTMPMSMLLIGAILADADIKSLFSRDVLYFSFLRLIAFPLVIYAVLALLPLDPLLVSITVLLNAMPAGSLTSIMAEQYNCDSQFASQAVFATTLLSMVTLPLLCLIL